MLRWHAITVRLGREQKASISIGAMGFEVYLPLVGRRLSARAGSGLIDAARFPGWVFTRFNVDEDDWQRIGQGRLWLLYQTKILCTAAGTPIPMPDKALAAMKAYTPPPPDAPRAMASFEKGQPVFHYTAGVPQQAVFVGYRKRRALVELWILGRPRTVTVAVGALEEINGA